MTKLILAKLFLFGSFFVNYDELFGIIEGYETESSISNLLIVESDYLKVVNSLNSHEKYNYEF